MNWDANLSLPSILTCLLFSILFWVKSFLWQLVSFCFFSNCSVCLSIFWMGEFPASWTLSCKRKGPSWCGLLATIYETLQSNYSSQTRFQTLKHVHSLRIKLPKNIHCVAHSSGNYKLVNRLLSELRSNGPVSPRSWALCFQPGRAGQIHFSPKKSYLTCGAGVGGRIFKPQIAICKTLGPWQCTQV